MKNKKYFNLFILFLILLVLTGCGKSNKQTLIDYFDETSKRKSGQIEFSMKIKDVDTSGESKLRNSAVDGIPSYIEGSSIEGKLYSDGSAYKGEMEVQALKYKVPFNFIEDQKNLYVKLDFLPPINKALAKFGGSNYDLKGDSEKFADVFSFLEHFEILNKDQLKENENIVKQNIRLRNLALKTLKNSISELPKDSINRNGDVITFTIHKKDMLNYMKKLKNEIDHDKEIKSNPVSQEVIDNFDERFKNFDCVIKCNPKKNTVNSTITGITKKNYKTVVEIKMKNGIYDQKIEIPSKNEIIDNDKLANYLDKVNK